jgi:ketosteroid isomerase-like protein
MTPYFRSLPIAIATLAFSTHAAAGAGNTRSEIARQEASWMSALATGDIDRLVAMYEDEAWLIVPGAEPFQGRDAIRAALSHLRRQRSA